MRPEVAPDFNMEAARPLYKPAIPSCLYIVLIQWRKPLYFITWLTVALSKPWTCKKQKFFSKSWKMSLDKRFQCLSKKQNKNDREIRREKRHRLIRFKRSNWSKESLFIMNQYSFHCLLNLVFNERENRKKY